MLPPTAFRAIPHSAALSDHTQNRKTPEPAIAVRNVDLVFESRFQSFQALTSANLTIQAGTLHLIMGPAGAGKTSLLLVMAGLLKPTAGDVMILGRSLNRLSRPELERLRSQQMGIMFQEVGLIRTLTALENVELALHFKGIQGGVARQQAEQLLAAVGLSDKRYLLPRLLSVGQQQRIGVARALAGSPRLIIADEPTSALDSANGQIVIELFRQQVQTKAITVLIATHDDRITSWADQISYLEDGLLKPSSSPLSHLPSQSWP